MNAVAVFQPDRVALGTWQEPRISYLPTFVETLVTLAVLFAVWFHVSDGWPVYSPTAIPTTDPIPVGPRPTPSPSRDHQGLVYYVVASTEQEDRARAIFVSAGSEEASGVIEAFNVQREVRMADSPRAEVTLMFEIGLAADAWGAQGMTVKVADLR